MDERRTLAVLVPVSEEAVNDPEIEEFAIRMAGELAAKYPPRPKQRLTSYVKSVYLNRMPFQYGSRPYYVVRFGFTKQ